MKAIVFQMGHTMQVKPADKDKKKGVYQHETNFMFFV